MLLIDGSEDEVCVYTAGDIVEGERCSSGRAVQAGLCRCCALCLPDLLRQFFWKFRIESLMEECHWVLQSAF